MLEVIKIVMQDEVNMDEKNEYFVLMDEKYFENIEKLREDISYNYETYQDIEDFIHGNFTVIDIKDIEILY